MEHVSVKFFLKKVILCSFKLIPFISINANDFCLRLRFILLLIFPQLVALHHYYYHHHFPYHSRHVDGMRRAGNDTRITHSWPDLLLDSIQLIQIITQCVIKRVILTHRASYEKEEIRPHAYLSPHWKICKILMKMKPISESSSNTRIEKGMEKYAE